MTSGISSISFPCCMSAARNMFEQRQYFVNFISHTQLVPKPAGRRDQHLTLELNLFMVLNVSNQCSWGTGYHPNYTPHHFYSVVIFRFVSGVQVDSHGRQEHITVFMSAWKNQCQWASATVGFYEKYTAKLKPSQRLEQGQWQFSFVCMVCINPGYDYRAGL